MRATIMTAALAATLLGAGPAAARATPTAMTTFSVACRHDAEISTSDRAALETFGTTLFELVAARTYDDLYLTLAPEMQQQISLKAVQDLFESLHHAMLRLDPQARLANGRVTRVYMVDVLGTPPDRFTSCHGADGAIEAEVAISDAPRQAHVILEGEGGGMRWGFSLWLRQKESRWEVWGFNFINITMGGRDAQAMWTEAKAARARDQHMLAAMLYRGAKTLARRGDYFILPIHGQIEAEIRAYDANLLQVGPLAALWEDGAVAYGFAEAGIAQNTDGTLRAVFTRYMSVWPSAAAVEAENRVMIRSFLKAFPEFAGVFAGVEVRAVHPDNETVETTEWRIDRRRFL